MLQKAKSIKKTLKTEAKAIAYGTERVDKRGKPVTSIADRTNVRRDFDLIFAWVLRCLSLMGWQDFSKRSRSLSVVYVPFFLFFHADTLQFFLSLTRSLK